MSRRNSDVGPQPVPDVYVGLLFVSLAALIMGITFLWLELAKYGFKISP